MTSTLRTLCRLPIRAMLVWLLASLPLQAFETRATAAWVYDVATHTVLMDKSADVPLPPASMSKLMTINMLFEALRDGRVTMDTTFAVSALAASMGGSTMFLQESDRPTVKDLIYGMIINSGNDACVVVAEGLAGTEEAFAAQMTERAQALGLTGSVFRNASGWPDPDHKMTMRDLGILSLRLIEEFPEYYPIFGQTTFNYMDRAAANANNRNPLLKIGAADWRADGLKTGHTEEAGFGLVGSAVMGERRVIFAITGLDSDKARAEEAESIANWAFRQFVMKTVGTAGARVAEADVFLGSDGTVGLVPEKDVTLLLPALVQETLTAEVVYKGPLMAPIAAGTLVGELVIQVPGLPDHRVALHTEADVTKAGFGKRLTTAAQSLWVRYMGDEAPAS